MKLGYMTIMVRDLEKTLAFYEALVGLKIVRRIHPGMGEIAFLANAEQETMLEFVQFENSEKVEAKGLVLSFSADEPLQALREKAIGIGLAPSALTKQGPKPEYFTVRDPDGLLIEFS